MNRIQFITGLFSLCVIQAMTAATALNVTQFGAKGDGVTDDYAALQAAATAVCKTPGATLVFPPGTYKIDRHRVVGGAKKNTTKDIQYTNCNGVTISGYGAKIDVQGNFARNPDVYPTSAYAVSYDEGIIPFFMLNSTGFTISGFELDGNVDQMSRSPIVIEGMNAGVLTRNCNNYQLLDLYIHHFHTDGISLGHGSTVADTGATLTNITAKNNARQGLSVLQVRGAKIDSSLFSDTGVTGNYGMHSPGAGADVEPERTPPAVNVKTGLIEFTNCRFEENLGSQFISTVPSRVESVTVRNSVIRATRAGADPAAYLNAAATSVNTGNTFYLAAQKAIVLGPTSAVHYPSLVQATYSGNTIQASDRFGIYPPIQYAPVDFVGNTVTVTPVAPEKAFLMFSNINRASANTFNLAASGYAGNTGTLPYAIVYMGVKTVTGNQYTTNLTSPKSFYTIYYGPGMQVSAEAFLTGTTFKGLTIQ